MKRPALYAVVMAGGSGERFWPRSRAKTPKHLLDIAGSRSMIRMTVDRIRRRVPADRIFIVTHRSQKTLLRREVPEIPARNVLAEPVGRDTAPCIAYAASVLHRIGPDALMLVLPADHVIENEKAFWSIVDDAAPLVSGPEGALLTIGIRPRGPRTGYGYIERGAPEAAKGAKTKFFRVRRFTEKPDAARARRYVQSGRFYWNSGMFLWSVASIRREFAEHAPEIAACFRPLDGPRLPGLSQVARVYERSPRISIDYAVMEKSRRVLVAEGAFDWNDVGSWASVRPYLAADAGGNASVGRFASHDCRGCTVFSDRKGKHLVAAVGLENMVIVHTDEATLVCPEGRAEEIKKLVSALKKDRELIRYT